MVELEQKVLQLEVLHQLQQQVLLQFNLLEVVMEAEHLVLDVQEHLVVVVVEELNRQVLERETLQQHPQVKEIMVVVLVVDLEQLHLLEVVVELQE
jgi:hypothetical protein